MVRLALLLAMMVLAASPARAEPPPPLGGMLPVPELWQAYKGAFISPAGRIIDNANGDVSHSEGQGYGMLIAVAADDRPAFDLIWSWTREQLMLREDGLAAWRWKPDATPHVADRNNASDGDLLIAWALAEAGERWSETAYKTASLQIARAIRTSAIAESRFGPLLKPGATGFGPKDRQDGPVFNLSYWVFPAFQRLSQLQEEQSWKPVAHAGLDMAREARFGPKRLPSDWISIAGDEVKPAAGFPPVFGYDAIRIPLYLLWGGMVDKPFGPYRRLFVDDAAEPARIDVTTGDAIEPLTDSGYRAIAALARCAVRGDKIPAEFKAPTVDRYYPTTLRLLTLIAARQRYPQCL